jgi:hypothetical protein
MKPQDFKDWDPTQFSRTVKLLVEDSAATLETLEDKPWCVAPGLLYSICKFDRSLVEAFKEESNCPDSSIKRYVLAWPLFDIPNTEFTRLTASREVICLENAVLFEAFKDFCCSIQINDKSRNKNWTVGAWTADYPNRDKPTAPEHRVVVLCPFDTEFVYYPVRKSVLDIGYTITKTRHTDGKET